MYKLIIPAVMVVFSLWILLQLSMNINIFQNPMNYFTVITLFFLCIQELLKNRQ
ncbi:MULTISPECIES: hypothetical protein [Bacillus]|uniref:hypothetical protein n=1 Tax=Bacillus TaxID=1386 RepID=UPI000B0DB91B|nr:hypothetical protein [Bacillus altitudinis]NQW97479.1 hypothetical protein [Bacillus stratosphericus]UTV32841.1 hypothetical protein NM966_19075 [Bacillus altitudinis]